MKPILKKADEMEMAINLKAARNSYAFLSAAVMIYSLITFATTGEMPLMFLFGCISGVIFWMTKLVETKRLTASEQDDEELH